ncbi:hypothetical protein FGRMN_4732 [Fusarium graminum]|nr:hypothetical protein FGRMN_4732 [Fusarium graminum]
MCFVCPHGAAFEDTAPFVDAGYKGKAFNDQAQLSSRSFDLCMHIWTDPTQSMFINKSFESENDTATFVGADEDHTGEIWDDIARVYRYKSVASSDTIYTPLIKGNTMWETYAHAVDIYTKRDMSWQSDAVNSFIGITDLILRGTNTKFWQGLPEFALSRALLWYAREPLTRRRSEDGQALFPSWSWAAWKGHVSYRGRGWRNAVAYAPATMVMWFTKKTAQELMESYMREERTQEEIEEFRRQVGSTGTILQMPKPAKLLQFEYEEQGWRIEHDDVRNQHIYLHEAYPGVRLESPMSLPGESIVELPCKDNTLYFDAKVVSARLCNKPATAYQASPIQDNFLQIGLNDEDRSANARRPWQRILYHQGYRAGSLTLNVPLQDLNIPCTSETTSEEYLFAAITRHGVPHIVMPIEKVILEEWTKDGDAPPEPDEGVEPDCQKVNENGDPRWDAGRFGAPAVFDVCDVLLLRKKEGVCERVGVGKVSWCAFHAAKPGNDMIQLK